MKRGRGNEQRPTALILPREGRKGILPAHKARSAAQFPIGKPISDRGKHRQSEAANMAAFTNQATLSYRNGTTTSNIVTGELVEVLSASKTAVSSTYTPGGRVTYIISIVNSGATDYTGLTLTDNLGRYTVGSSEFVPLDYVAGSIHYYRGGVEQPAPTVTAGPPLVVTGISVPADGSTTIVYEAQVNSTAPINAESCIINTAEISGAGITTPITVNATVNAVAEPSLTISKAICPPTVVENGQITYTFVIQNSGNTAAAAADEIVVSDTFDPILENLNVTLDGTELTAGTGYAYNQTTGEFSTTAGTITVPAATYTQNAETGEFTVTPGVAVLTVTGTV